ncbi:hypothetical protein COX74_00910 [bacterium (Candidatus Gribaldobacteria) CG_4_10_14_0_2_um_filter_41_16]|uniref:Uncharacterized protein n=1 Tax=bacterium (Candidatus Gribaldobacteria) CG_4_10_14_0_2_um_filter_41_16 TaxID=2014265 RepID=A0A2M7VIW0_9BACT|nr:MAG: hypothetical protein COX74_00910 [bacterium (Candidatus Gribaldobacteria) CG_4_10_14_0_2_um_filter_41_16]
MLTRKIHWRAFLLLGLTLGVVFLLAPLSSQAAWYDYLTPTGLASGFVGLILKIILGITGLLVRFANWFVTWTLGNPYNISYTRPGLRAPDNFVIEIGWTLLRDLVNMAFILGLAYIGFSTALDFGNKFKTKKTFLNLLLIALLINFTPAICGAVVDVGNILGSFFIQGADFSTLSAIFERQQGFLARDWSNIITDGTLMFNTLMLIGFGIVAALVLSIYGILFLARGPIIWLLVILSPAAFFCYIFEKTKKQFDQWWELFLQWALILPVLLGFFLYLSMQILARTNEIMSVSGGEVSGFLNQILPYTIPVGFLVAGLFLTTSKLMGGGAKAILGVAKGAALGVAGGVGANALFAGKKGVSSARNAWRKSERFGDAKKPGEEGYEEWQQKHKVIAKANEIGRFAFGGETATEKANWGTGTKIARKALRYPLAFATLGAAYWANPARKRINAKIGGALDEERDKKSDKRVEELKGKSVSFLNATLENAMPGIVSRQERLNVAEAMMKNPAPLSAFTALTPTMRKQLIEDALNDNDPERINHFKALDPMITAEIVKRKNLSKTWLKKAGLDLDPEKGEMEKYGKYGIDPLAAKIIAEARKSQMESYSMETLKIAADSNLINDFWNGTIVGRAGELLGAKAVQAIQDNLKTQEYYMEIMPNGRPRNAQLGNYIVSQTGRALGLGFKDEEGKIDFKAERTKLKNE